MMMDITSITDLCEVKSEPPNTEIVIKKEEIDQIEHVYVTECHSTMEGVTEGEDLINDDKNISYDNVIGTDIINIEPKTEPEEGFLQPHKSTQMYSCDLCDFKALKKSFLEQHKRFIHRTYHCELCLFETSVENVYIDHIKYHSSTNKLITCTLCNYKDVSLTTVQRHYNTVHRGKKLTEYNCDKCPYKAMFKWSLNSHQRRHLTYRQRYLSCKRCQFIAKNTKELREHAMKHQCAKFMCGFCKAQYNHKGNFKRHLVSQHGIDWDGLSDYSRSPEGDLVLVIQSNPDHHQSETDKDNEQKPLFKDEKNQLKEILNPHQVPTSRVLLEPSDCDSTVNTDPMLHNIIQNNDPESSNNIQDTPYDKKQCEKSHIPSPTEPEYSCRQCSFKTTDDSTMVRHQLNHIKSGVLLQCLECDFSVFGSHKLNRHMISSHKEMIDKSSFVCVVCGQRSATHSWLKNHLRRHLHPGDKTKCSRCDFAALTKHMLEDHFRTVHGEVNVE